MAAITGVQCYARRVVREGAHFVVVGAPRSKVRYVNGVEHERRGRGPDMTYSFWLEGTGECEEQQAAAD